MRPSQVPSARRLLSLDVFRGITIAGMVVVNSPGNDDNYAFLAHAPWHGWTPADFVFPGFLVIMGASLAISLGRRLERGDRRKDILLQVLWRGAVMLGLGLAVSGVTWASGSTPTFRVPGVLQRIAACYLLCSVFYLWTGPRSWARAAFVLLAGTRLLMSQTSAPGFPAGDLSPAGNFASYLDRMIFGDRIYTAVFDPEGLFTTLPAAATALLGVLAGQWLRARQRQERKAADLFAAGALLVGAGQIWAIWLPINKNLWTGSYALFTGGLALWGLSVCYLAVEIFRWRTWGLPFVILGRNPLLAYFLSELFFGLQEFVKMTLPDGSPGNLKLWLCARLFGGWLSPPNAALAYSLVYLGFCLAVMAVLHRRRIYLKI